MTGSASPDGTGTQSDEIDAALTVTLNGSEYASVRRGAASVLSAEIERLRQKLNPPTDTQIGLIISWLRKADDSASDGDFDPATGTMRVTIEATALDDAANALALLASAAAPDERQAK